VAGPEGPFKVPDELFLARADHEKALKALELYRSLYAQAPDNAEAARDALRAGNIRFEEKEVITVLLENRATRSLRET
jgi:hypothetical protein